MKHTLMHVIALVIIASTVSSKIQCTTSGKTFFATRSQSSNTARRLADTAHYIDTYKKTCSSWDLYITPQYQQTFDDHKTGRFLFFNGTPSLQFGSAGAAGVDVFSRNFLLNDDFVGIAKISPSIKNFVLDFGIYSNNFCNCEYLFAALYIPINWTRWNMNLENIVTSSGTSIAANAVGNSLPTSSPIGTIVNAWQGTFINQIIFPAIQQQMNFATINGRQSLAGVADIHLLVGYHILHDEYKDITINGQLILPTGTRPHAHYFFEPITGNGKHFELGIGTCGFYELWQTSGAENLSLYWNGWFAHPFSTHERRTFDLTNNGVGSRYLLFKQFNGNFFTGQILFGPNVTTQKCRVHVAFEMDMSIELRYKQGEISYSFGTDIWLRTKEHITIMSHIPENTYGIQGLTQTAGASANTTASQTRINGTNATQFDAQVVYVTTQDLNSISAENPRADTYTFFASVDRTWYQNPYMPILGLTGFIELSAKSNHAVQTWGAWAKIGFIY